MSDLFNSSSDKLDVTKKNIERLDRHQTELFESRTVLIREFCSAALSCAEKEAPLFDKLREAYSSAAFARNFYEAREISKAEGARSFFASLSAIEKLEFCRELIKASGISASADQILAYADDSPAPDPILSESRGRIAYMKNNFTESAFLKFSKVVANSRSAYLQSFDAVCEEVYSGRCEYCILPIESSSEGRLSSFYSMIDRYELKIATVCTVEQHDSQRFTKFALLKKSIVASSLLRTIGSNGILEFKVSSATGSIGSPDRDNSPVCDILLAASASGMRLLSIDSMPLPYNDEMTAYYISLAFDGSLPTAFLLYITLEFPQFDPLGVYFAVN